MPGDFSTLTYLARCWLHEDFVEENGSAAGAVDDFIRTEPRHAALLPAEVERALSLFTTEEQARSFVLDDLDSCYLVEHGGLTYRGWLQSVADRAQELGGHDRARRENDRD